MNAAKYVLLAWLLYAAVVTVRATGRPPVPVTPGTAAASVVMVAGLAWLVVLA